ncbi:MAG: ABC transporter ATP-binding protein, partial [Pseudomonadota bacterium]
NTPPEGWPEELQELLKPGPIVDDLGTDPPTRARLWQMINQNLRVAMISRAEYLSLRFHSQSRVGDAIFRVYQDSATITSLIQEAIVSPITAIYGVIMAIGFVAFFDPRIAAVCVAVLFPIGALTIWITPRLRARSIENRVANSDLTSRLQESMVALRVVKANQGEQQVLKRFSQDSHRALDAALYLRLHIAGLHVLVMSVAAIAIIGIEYVLVYWVLGERETFLGAAAATMIGFAIWNLGAFEDARGRVGGALFGSIGLVDIWSRLQDLFVGLERAFYLLDLEPDIIDPGQPEPFPQPLRSVTWDNVSFGYEVDRPIFNNVTLTAQAGTITAIVGASGAGKSTLMSLLLRLYDPTEGRVLMDETELTSLGIEDIRSHISIALQRNVLFAGTVADNIGYAAQNVSRDEIVSAAQVACADDFVNSLEDGFDTELGERGGKLSTGQRQRISLARAIVRDTPILILDEPTASLDAERELAVMQNLAEWGRDKIIFLITHRLSTIRTADQIAFLSPDQPLEVGSHGELMSLEGRYRTFFEASLGAVDV